MTDVKAPDTPLTSNPTCVEFLEKWLAKAKEGNIVHVALAVVEAPDKIFADSVGEIAFQSEMHIALDTLRRGIDEACEARMAPIDPSVTADQVCYNLASGIVSFDFLPWIIGAEMRRRREHAAAPLKVAFYRNSHSRFLPYHDQMLQNVVGPLTEMVGATTNKVLGGRSDFPVTYREIVAAHQRGELVPWLAPRPDIAAGMRNILNGSKPITITLREAIHHPHRNSNIEAWCRFAEYLKAQGEEVIFIRDYSKADEELPGQTIFTTAATDLHARLALYGQSKMNLGVSNGPMTLCWHLATPFLFFNELDPHGLKRYMPGWPDWWPRHHGIEAGDQFPWFTERQRIVWHADTFDNLVLAYDALTA